MQNFFSWEDEKNNSDIPVYMPHTKIKPLGLQNIGSMVSSGSRGIQPAAGQMGNPRQYSGGQPPTSGGLSGRKPSDKDSNNTTSPDYEMKTPDFSSVPNYTGADPWNPEHYEGIFVDPENPIWSDIRNGLQELVNPVFDPSNYEGLLNEGLLGGGGLSDLNPVFDSGAYEGTLYDINNPFGLQPETGGLMGKLGSIYDKFSDIVPWLSAAKLGYDLFTGEGDTASKIKQGITQGVPTGLGLIAGSGPAAPLTAAMYGGLALMQAIGANQNKPSRDYFDPYYQADLGDGMQFLLGASRGEHQSEITPEQSWTQVLQQLAGGSKNAAFVKNDTGQLFGIPMDVLFNQGMSMPRTEEEQFLDQAGMGGSYGIDEDATRNWLGQTYRPEDINQRIMDYMSSGDAQRVQLGMFKDTPVIGGTGKDPLVYESVLEGFQASQPYFGNEYGAYDPEWISPEQQTNQELLDFLA